VNVCVAHLKLVWKRLAHGIKRLATPALHKWHNGIYSKI